MPLAVERDGERYLESRLATLHDTLAVVNARTGNDDLPDASLDAARLAPSATESRVSEAAWVGRRERSADRGSPSLGTTSAEPATASTMTVDAARAPKTGHDRLA